MGSVGSDGVAGVSSWSGPGVRCTMGVYIDNGPAWHCVQTALYVVGMGGSRSVSRDWHVSGQCGSDLA